MRSLPVELLEAVLGQVSSHSTLLQLRASNSLFYMLATPLAFRSICLINSDKSLNRFHRITDRQDLAQHIHQVIYQYEEADPNAPIRQCNVQGFDGISFVKALAIISQLPSLKELVLKFRADDGPFGDYSPPKYPPEVILQFLIFKALGEDYLQFSSPLKSLTIDHFLPLPHPSFGEPTVIRLLGTLTQLTINTTINCPAFGMTSPPSDVSAFPIYPTEAFSSSLVSLQLHHESLRPPTMIAPLTELHLPRLAHLSIQRHYFSDIREVENFIARHGETLVELKLFLCPMATSAEAILCPKANPARFRRWAQVWDHLRRELKVLKNLVVSERNDSNGIGDCSLGRYVDFDYRFTTAGLGKAEMNDDEDALKRLQEVVESRIGA